MTQKERLIELLPIAVQQCRGSGGTYEGRGEIADYLLDNGVLLPPVKVGDFVYYIRGGYYDGNRKEAVPIEVTEISQKMVRGKWQLAFIANGTRYTYRSIGETVFFTREEAEAKIRSMHE